MARSFNFSIATTRGETFQVEGCSSFDEAIKIVEKGVYDRELYLIEKADKEKMEKLVVDEEASKGITPPEPGNVEPLAPVEPKPKKK